MLIGFPSIWTVARTWQCQVVGSLLFLCNASPCQQAPRNETGQTTAIARSALADQASVPALRLVSPAQQQPDAKPTLEKAVPAEASFQNPGGLYQQFGLQLLNHLMSRSLDVATTHRETLALKDCHPSEKRRAYQLYHIAKLLGSAGDSLAARQFLKAIILEKGDDECVSSAQVLLAIADEIANPEIGSGIVNFNNLSDLNKQHVVLPDGPTMVVFFSCSHTPALRRLSQIAKAWLLAGQTAQSMVAFALESDVDQIKQATDPYKLQCHLIPGDRGFLNPVWRGLDVRAVPSTYLLSSNGTLLASNLLDRHIKSLLSWR